jgi:dTDP-4-dehydrorhamnose reductase
VLSLVDALSAGREFVVWHDDAINGVASPVTAAEIGARVLLALERRADGVLHVVGADAVTRVELALAAVEVFELDRDLVRSGPVPDGAMLPASVPFDTSLATPRSDEVLGVPPFGIMEQLRALRSETETGRTAPLTT